MRVNKSEWFKSSYSAQNGACVEARHRADGGMDLRDSKNHSGPVVTLEARGWSTFATAVRKGAFATR
jgi:hypothetical protein